MTTSAAEGNMVGRGDLIDGHAVLQLGLALERMHCGEERAGAHQQHDHGPAPDQTVQRALEAEKCVHMGAEYMSRLSGCGERI